MPTGRESDTDAAKRAGVGGPYDRRTSPHSRSRKAAAAPPASAPDGAWRDKAAVLATLTGAEAMTAGRDRRHLPHARLYFTRAYDTATPSPSPSPSITGAGCGQFSGWQAIERPLPALATTATLSKRCLGTWTGRGELSEGFDKGTHARRAARYSYWKRARSTSVLGFENPV